mgnify:FL=1
MFIARNPYSGKYITVFLEKLSESIFRLKTINLPASTEKKYYKKKLEGELMINKDELDRLNKLAEKAVEVNRGVVVIPEEVEFVKIPEKATFVRGHYRRINGKRVYIKPYLRRRRKK